MRNRILTACAAALAGTCFAVTGGSALGAAYTWVGPTDGTGTWSTLANWDSNGSPAASLPGSSDDVTLAGTAANTIVDQNFTINSLTLSGVGSATSSGLVKSNNAVLTINSAISINFSKKMVSVPIALGGNVTYTDAGTGYPYGIFSSVITEAGGSRSMTFNGTYNSWFSGNNTFTGGFHLNSGTLIADNYGGTPLGRGTVYFGDSNSSGNARLTFQNTNLGGWTNVPIIVDGSGTHTLYTNYGGNSAYTLPMHITLNSDLVFDGQSATGLHALTGQISGAAGLVQRYTGVLTLNTTAKTYTGHTLVEAGTLTLDSTSSLANADITITPAVNGNNAAMNGTGTITFQNGDVITVSGAVLNNISQTGSLDASQLHFDLSELTPGDYELVNYLGGSVTLPSNLQDLLTAPSQGMGFIVQNRTGVSQVWVVVPEPTEAALAAFAACGLFLLGRRRRNMAG